LTTAEGAQPPRKKGRLAANLAISLAALLLMAALLEVGLRLFYPPASLVKSYRLPDPILGWRLQAGAEVVRRRPEYRVTVAINSQGWRDVEHPVDKPAGTFRVVVLGDSFMEAYTVALDDSFSRQLERAAHAARADSVEVLNLGVTGYGTYQEYLLFVEEAARYQPDLVLLAFYAANDVHNNSRALESILWGPDDPNFFSRPYLEEQPGGEWEAIPPDYARALALAEQNSRRWWTRSALYGTIDAVVGAHENDNDLAADLFLCEPTAGVEQAWRTTAHILLALKEAVHDSGAELAVFTVPSRQEVDADAMRAFVEKQTDPTAYCLEESALNARLLDVLDEEDIAAVDLLPAFREAEREEGIDLYYRLDRHWNADGHTLAAQEVFAELVQRGMLPAE
jgi:hypothetical protein